MIRLLFFGSLKEIVGEPQQTLEFGKPCTTGELLESLCAKHETLRKHLPSILIARNREFTTRDTPIEDNDEIAFLPPVSGGSHQHIFRITREVIDTPGLVRELMRPEDGAVVT